MAWARLLTELTLVDMSVPNAFSSLDGHRSAAMSEAEKTMTPKRQEEDAGF